MNSRKKSHTTTISPVTRMRYIERAEMLIERFEVTQGLSWRESPEEFREWADNVIAPTLSPASRRQYRAAMALYHREAPGTSEASAPRFSPTKATDEDGEKGRSGRDGRPRRASTTRSSKRGGARNSATRAKGIPEDAYFAILKDLAPRTAVLAQMAGAMLVASRTFGLRPSEWADAEFETRLDPRTGIEHYRLRVRNAKYSEGRSFGEYRTLISDSRRIEEYEANAAGYTIDRVRDYLDEHRKDKTARGEPFVKEEVLRRLFDGINRHIRLACKRQKVREHVTIYSARHQFSADAKAAGLGRVLVAALMGHGSIETAGSHYGKRQSGRGGGKGGRAPMPDAQALEAPPEDVAARADTAFRASPDPGDVARVQERNSPNPDAKLARESDMGPKWSPNF